MIFMNFMIEYSWWIFKFCWNCVDLLVLLYFMWVKWYVWVLCLLIKIWILKVGNGGGGISFWLLLIIFLKGLLRLIDVKINWC